MVIKINDKEYNVGFTFRVARNEKYKEALKMVSETFMGVGNLLHSSNIPVDFMSMVVNGVSDKPNTCVTLLYLGLTHDDRIKTMEDAWNLMFDYMEQGEDMSYDKLYTELLGQMGDDGFFKWSGFNQTIERMTPDVKKLKEEIKK